MNIVRQLTSDEYEKWDEFVARSPEGGVFQTIAWNQMICDTSPQPAGFLPLVSLDEKGFQAGILVCYSTKSGRKISDFPLFGYVSPVLSPELNYADRHHTYKNYTILAELLKQLVQEIKYIRMENGPEIWDIRPHEFQDWGIETTYTHIWEGGAAGAWEKIDQEIKKTIETAGQNFTFKEDEEWKNIERFLKGAGAGVITRERVEWLRKRGAGRLYLVTDQKGTVSGMTLAILSRENQTAYLWGSKCNELKMEKEVLPYLYWKSYETLANDFPRMDLGGSERYEIGLVKDKLGSEPVPRFVTTFGKK